MISIVSEVSNERAKYIFKKMPLKVVYAYEHFFFLKNGYECTVLAHKDAVEELLLSL
jgi:hypothetical protein